MMVVKFHPDAEAEMLAAAAYYKNQQPNLGRRFLVAVQDAANRLAATPGLYPVVDLDVRRCLVKTFSLRPFVPDSRRSFYDHGGYAPKP
jgi:toxin ParE1/3/4